MKSTAVDAIKIGNGPIKILALHASGTGAGSLVRLARAMGEQVEVLIPNLHGYGESKSSVNPDASPLEQHFDVAERALAQFANNATHIIGHSMGGLIALWLAIRHEREISSLHLAEPVAFGALDQDKDADVIDADRSSVHGLKTGATDGIATFIEYWNGTPWASLPDALRQTLTAMSDQITREALDVSNDQTPAVSYRRISCPVHLMVGEKTNRVARRISFRLQESHPGWNNVTVAAAGHMLPIEQPDVLASLISARLP